MRDPARESFGGGEVFEGIARVGVLPILVLDHAEDAVPVAEALLAGGLPLAEITLRTEAAPAALAAMAKVPGLLVGAGTLLRPEQVDQAIDLGARFGLAPGFAARVAARAVEKGFPFLPGVQTPTEIGAALDAGFAAQKFFPAEPAGGVAYLKAASAPFPGARFVPTGSIGAARLRDYLALPSVLAVGGNWMVAPDLIRARRWDEIARLAAEATATVRDVRAAADRPRPLNPG